MKFIKVYVLLFVFTIITDSFVFSQNGFNKNEFGIDFIYGNAPDWGGNKHLALSPFYYKHNFLLDKNESSVRGLRYGLGVGVFPLVFLSKAVYIFGIITPNPFLIKHDLFYTFGNERNRLELGYVGIISDKELFSSKNSYTNGIFFGKSFKVNRKNIFFDSGEKRNKRSVFFRIRANSFLVNSEYYADNKISNKLKLYPSLTFSINK